MPEQKTLERARRDKQKEKHQPHKPASLCAKKWNTFGKANTARGQPNKPSPSAFRKRAAPGLNSRRLQDPRLHQLAGALLLRLARRNCIVAPLDDVPARLQPHSSAKVMQRRLVAHYRATPELPQNAVPQQAARQPRAKP